MQRIGTAPPLRRLKLELVHSAFEHLDMSAQTLDSRVQLDDLLLAGNTHGMRNARISVVSPLVVVAVTVQLFTAVAVCVYTTLWPLVTS